MEDELHIGVADITDAINKTFKNLGWKYVVCDNTVREALKNGKLRPYVMIGKAYAMYQSWIEKIADPNCELYESKEIREAIGVDMDQFKYLRRTGHLDWLDMICGRIICVQGSADNYKEMLNDMAVEQKGKRGRPRKFEYTDQS